MNNSGENIEQSKTRKKKLDLEELWTKCKTCLEPHNIENLILHKLPIKNSQGIELYGAFNHIYFCSENCKGLWSS
jgi:hypothetical protein